MKILVFILAVLLISPYSTKSEEVVKGETFIFTFQNGHESWEGGFADYPVSSEFFYKLAWGWENLPVSDEPNGKGLRLSGVNHSDDLFMFVKRQLIGNLEPLTLYDVRFKATLVTNAPRGCAGIGGAPGEGVYFKAGVSNFEPKRRVDQNNHYRMTVDKGNQSVGGKQAIVLGHIANNNEDCDHWRYEVKRLESASPLAVRANEKGEVWLFFGTDSGFEGETTLYLEKLEAAFSAQSPIP